MGNSESSPSTPSRREKDKEKEKELSRGRSSGASEGKELPTVPKKSSTARTYTQTPPHLSSTASTWTSNEQATATHSRSRSQTTNSPSTTTTAVPTASMGNGESRAQRPPSRSSTLDTPPQAADQRPRSPLSKPVDVPQPPQTSHEGHGGAEAERADLTPPTSPPFGLPASVFAHPPRLPIPIERDPEPASPILTPQQSSAGPLGKDGEAGATVGELGKRASLLSQTTLDGDGDDEEDGAADIQQFAMETDSLAPKVPTTLTWKGDGRAVYVTGTFASWEKKFRMQRSATGVFTTTIPLTPGTHHITFLVDGDPKTSRDLPTTVDFANALVNYIEVVPPPVVEKQQQQQPQAEAIPIPGASSSSSTARTGGTPVGSGIPLRDNETVAGPPRTADGVPSSINETVAPAPNVSLRPHSLPQQPSPLQQQQSQSQQQHAQPPQPQLPTQPTTQQQQPPQQQPQQPQQPSKPKPAPPRPKYTTTIPDILLHLDLYNTPADERYRRASKAIQHLSQPPSLPMFMSKSILNANTPQKDDASVLTMPNHTVLNHLATSSIRNGVLATSGTTRYKRKFLTTIMYKPTSDDG